MKDEITLNDSIADLISNEEIPMPMPIIGKEMMLYSEFYKGKLMEYEDRKQVKNMQRKGFKFFLGSSIIALEINRGITLLRTKSRDFMNLHFSIRILIRGISFAVTMYTFCYIPILKELFLFRDGLNKKYFHRYKQFMKTHDFLVMNPNLLNDPELSQEEYSHYIQMIENSKMMSQSKKNI